MGGEVESNFGEFANWRLLMAKLYNVSIIDKHDIWLKENEGNPLNWVVMSKEQLEQRLQRQIRSREEFKGRAIIEYDDIVWKKFL